MENRKEPSQNNVWQFSKYIQWNKGQDTRWKIEIELFQIEENNDHEIKHEYGKKSILSTFLGRQKFWI